MSAPPPTTRLFLRMLAPAIVTGTIVVLALPTLFASLLDLTQAQAQYARLAFALGTSGVVALIAIALSVGLRGLGGAQPDDEAARLRVLRLPVRLAAVVALFGGSITLGAVFLRLLTSRDPISLVLGVGLSSATLVGFLVVPTYVGARALLLPYALYFARESLPAGRRLPIGLLAGYTVLSVAAVAMVPAAVFGNAQLTAARDRASAARGQATARRLAHLLEGTPPVEALDVVSRVRLTGAIVMLRMPSGQLLPDERAHEAAGMPGQEAPLGGVLRGGAVRVVVQQRPLNQSVLLLVALGLVGLATVIATTLARALTRDARGVTRQVQALADDVPLPSVSTVSSSEVRRVTQSVNRLLDRIPRLQLEKFLAIERAEESRRLKSMFLANMSHDLRSPLNSILGFSELLTRGLEGPISDRQRAALEDIYTTGNHLLRLLTEILDTARAESGHLDLDRKPTPPATFVSQARKEALRGRPERVADQLTIDLQAGVAAVPVDALRMQQALTHVLNWAIDVARGVPVHVEVGDRDRGKGRVFVIEVLCERITMTGEEAALLFQPFRKIPGVAGLHLALPLARRVVEAHGGTLEPLGPAPGSVAAKHPGNPDNSDPGRHPIGVRIVLPRPNRRPQSGGFA